MTDALYRYLLADESGDDVWHDAERDVGRVSGPGSPVQVDAMEPAPIVQQLRSDDVREARAAFDALFRATYAKLVRFAVSYVKSMQSAEDAVGEVFAAVWTNRRTLVIHGTLDGYLFGAVRRRAVSVYRSAVRRDAGAAPVLADGEYWGMGAPAESPDAAVVGSDVRERLWRAIAELPERQREILALRWQGELGWEDIARVLGSTSAAVQMQHSRAAKTLRARLREYFR